MGRYTQRRRATTGPSPAPQPPPPLPVLTTVQGVGGGHVLTTWTHVVTFVNNFAVPGLSVNGPVPFAGSQAGTHTIDLDLGTDPTPGDPWDLTAQPSWIAETVDVPDSGVTT